MVCMRVISNTVSQKVSVRMHACVVYVFVPTTLVWSYFYLNFLQLFFIHVLPFF